MRACGVTRECVCGSSVHGMNDGVFTAKEWSVCGDRSVSRINT